MRIRILTVITVLLGLSAPAWAVSGIITGDVNLRAGPSVDFPVVDRLQEGSGVTIHGCIRSMRWCDVSFVDERGWVSAQFLDYYHGGRYVYLPSYIDVIGVPTASFVLTSYWSTWYIHRPWYHRHAYWNNYWASRTMASQPGGVQPAATMPAPAAATSSAMAVMPARPTAAPAAAVPVNVAAPQRAPMVDGARAAMPAGPRAMVARAGGAATPLRVSAPDDAGTRAQLGTMRGRFGSSFAGAPRPGGSLHNPGTVARAEGSGRRRH